MSSLTSCRVGQLRAGLGYGTPDEARMTSKAILIATLLLIPSLATATPCRKRVRSAKSAVKERRVPRKLGPKAGDTIPYIQKGSFFGLGVEHYLGSPVSIFVEGGINPFEDFDGDTEQFGFFRSEFPSPVVPSGFAEGGFSYLVNAGARLHALRKSRFDPYFGVGAGYYGYHVETNKGGGALNGGSVLLRLGSGVRYHFGRFNVAFDGGWYPLEIARLQTGDSRFPVRSDPSSSIPGADGEIAGADDAWMWNRFTAAFNVGFRF